MVKHYIPQDGYSYRLLSCKLLKLFDKPVSLILVVSGCPVIIKVIQDFDATVKFVQEISEHAHAAKSFDRI